MPNTKETQQQFKVLTDIKVQFDHRVFEQIDTISIAAVWNDLCPDWRAQVGQAMAGYSLNEPTTLRSILFTWPGATEEILNFLLKHEFIKAKAELIKWGTIISAKGINLQLAYLPANFLDKVYNDECGLALLIDASSVVWRTKLQSPSPEGLTERELVEMLGTDDYEIVG